MQEGAPDSLAILRFLRSPAELSEHVSPLTENGLVEFCETLLFAAAQIAFADGNRRLEVFARAERFGAHFLPVHFYSPIPTLPELGDEVFSRPFAIPGIVLDRVAQAELLRTLSAYASELSDVPEDAQHEFHWSNGAFGHGDAVCYYALLRHLRPRTVIEVGGGYSTFLAARAIKANGHGSVTCIEPYPSPDLEQLGASGQVRLLKAKVQDVPVETYDVLEENDVLFIDSTHVSKTGSDVNHLLFRVLPRLRAGVWCHIHDIFYPWDYPKEWVRDLKLFWSEQYLVMAFLAFNADFEVKLASHYVGIELVHEIGGLFVLAGRERLGGSSLWIRRSTTSQQRLRELTDQVSARDRELTTVYGSRGWRLLIVLWHIRARLAPQGSIRDRVLLRLVGWLLR